MSRSVYKKKVRAEDQSCKGDRVSESDWWGSGDDKILSLDEDAMLKVSVTAEELRGISQGVDTFGLEEEDQEDTNNMNISQQLSDPKEADNDESRRLEENVTVNLFEEKEPVKVDEESKFKVQKRISASGMARVDFEKRLQYQEEEMELKRKMYQEISNANEAAVRVSEVKKFYYEMKLKKEFNVSVSFDDGENKK